MKLIEQHIKAIGKLCKQFHVSELYVFGSVARDNATNNSDIDFLVQFSEVDPLEYFDNYMEFKDRMSELFSKEIDLTEMQTIKNPILKRSIDRDKILVYGRKNTKMAV